MERKRRKTIQAGFGLIENKHHITSFRVNGAELRTWFVSSISLQVTKQGSKKIERLAEGNLGVPFSFGHVVDLEGDTFHGKKLEKNFGKLKGFFTFDCGKIFTHKLYEYKVAFFGPKNFEKDKVASEIGILIQLDKGDSAKITFENSPLSLDLKNDVYLIEIENECSNSKHCPKDDPDHNDFVLSYKFLKVDREHRFKANRKDLRAMGEVEICMPSPRICIPTAFSKTLELPKDSDMSKPDDFL